MRYKVKPGKHMFWPRPLFQRFSKQEITFKVIFDGDCIYDLGNEDQADINKLYGLTSLRIHKNSARIGWRAEGKVIRIFAYWYRNGVRGWQDLGIVKPGEQHSYEVLIKKDRYIFKLDNREFIITDTPKWIPLLVFKALPYFGGNRTAPHNMSMYITLN